MQAACGHDARVCADMAAPVCAQLATVTKSACIQWSMSRQSPQVCSEAVQSSKAVGSRPGQVQHIRPQAGSSCSKRQQLLVLLVGAVAVGTAAAGSAGT